MSDQNEEVDSDEVEVLYLPSKKLSEQNEEEDSDEVEVFYLSSKKHVSRMKTRTAMK